MKKFRLVILPSLSGSSFSSKTIENAMSNVEEFTDIVVAHARHAHLTPASLAAGFLTQATSPCRHLVLDPQEGSLLYAILVALAAEQSDDTYYTIFWDGVSNISLQNIVSLLQSNKDLVCMNEQETFFWTAQAKGTPPQSVLTAMPRVIPLLSLSNILVSDNLIRACAVLDAKNLRDDTAMMTLAQMSQTCTFSRLSHFTLRPQDRLLALAAGLESLRQSDNIAYHNLVRYMVSPSGIANLFQGAAGKSLSTQLVNLYFGIAVPHINENQFLGFSGVQNSYATALCRALLQKNVKKGRWILTQILNGDFNRANIRRNDFSGTDQLLDELVDITTGKTIIAHQPNRENQVQTETPAISILSKHLIKKGPDKNVGFVSRLINALHTRSIVENSEAKTEDKLANDQAPVVARLTNFSGTTGRPTLDFSLATAGGFGHHVDGWNFVMQSFLEKAGHNPKGLGFDSFLEKSYVWSNGQHRDRRTKPWVGISHRPFNIPLFYDSNSKLQFFQTTQYMLDRPNNVGLITVATDHGQQLKKLLGVPVQTVLHPTNLNVDTWNPACLDQAIAPMLVQIGNWLRNKHSIFLMPQGRLRPAILGAELNKLLHDPRFTAEACAHNEGKPFGHDVYEHVMFLSHLSNDEYNDLLRDNIVFLDLYDATANNTVLECIARRTPIIVRRLPATVEYLGADYPLFFDTLAQAAAKADDRALLLAAHDYLIERAKLRDFSTNGFVDNMHAALERITAP